MAALDGALTLAEGDGGLAVAQHLHLDVAGSGDVAFEVDGGVVETGLGLGTRRRELGQKPAWLVHDLHAPATAAAGGLDDHGQADAFQGLLGLAVGFDDRGARHDGDAGGLHGMAGGYLVAHGAHDVGLGPDPGQAALLHDLGEIGVLRQKPVAGMDGISPRHLGGADEGGDVVVALARGGWADAHLLVGETHMQGIRVGGGMNRHRTQAEVPAGADHPQGDLAPIRYENLLEHACTVRGCWLWTFAAGGRGGTLIPMARCRSW